MPVTTSLLGTIYSLPSLIIPGSTPVSSSASLTAPSPAVGLAGTSTGNFTYAPGTVFTGTVTLTPSGTAAPGLSAQILTYSGSSASQLASWTPTVSGTLTITATNSGSLSNPPAVTYTVGNAAIPAATAGLTPGQAAGYTVYNTSGVVSHVRTTYGVTEIGNGVYFANIVALLPSDALVVWDDTQGLYAPMLLY